MKKCLKQKIKEYIDKLGLYKYPNVYIPNYIIETFKKEAQNDKRITNKKG